MGEITMKENTEPYSLPHFKPAPLLTGGQRQTLYPRFGPMRYTSRWGNRQLARKAQEIIIPAGDGIRLHCLLNRQLKPNRKPKPAPLIIMIHGWLGSSQSIYLAGTAHKLHQAGYHVVRLHLRDHGPSYHLNKTLFNAARIDEVFHAIRYIREHIEHKALGLLGYSLGGNFALRLANASQREQLGLDHVISICPVLNPKTAGDSIVNQPLYHQYFVKAWKEVFAIKHQLYRNFIDPVVFTLQDYNALTEHFVEHHTPFEHVDQYYQHYTIERDILQSLTVKTHAIIALDDPILPVPDFVHQLTSDDHLQLEITDTGGHCGFQKNWFGKSWIDHRVIEIFDHYLR